MIRSKLFMFYQISRSGLPYVHYALVLCIFNLVIKQHITVIKNPHSDDK